MWIHQRGDIFHVDQGSALASGHFQVRGQEIHQTPLDVGEIFVGRGDYDHQEDDQEGHDIDDGDRLK